MESPELPIGFQIIGTRGFYRPAGKVTHQLAAEMILSSVRTARDLGLDTLLVNSQRLTGHAPPTIFERHAFAKRWAENAGSRLHVAIVAREEMLDPQRIGMVMAQNRGVSGNVFTDEAAALAWLDSRPGKSEECARR